MYCNSVSMVCTCHKQIIYYSGVLHINVILRYINAYSRYKMYKCIQMLNICICMRYNWYTNGI